MELRERLLSPQVAGVGWLAARVWVGFKFLESGWDKVHSSAWVGDNAGAAVTGFLNGVLEKAPGGAAAGDHPEVTAWFATLTREIFLPNAALFGYLVAFGEVLVGIALILGIFTKFSAIMGLTMNFAFLFAGTSSDNVMMVLLMLPMVLVGGSAATYYGVDRFLMPVLKRWTERRMRPPAQPSIPGRISPQPR
jgi:thiosulfate dehydrogenase [quinone] large subunit